MNNNPNEITYTEKLKKIIATSKYNLTTLNSELNKINGTDTSVQNLSAKLSRGSLKYDEVVQILDILGYRVDWVNHSDDKYKGDSGTFKEASTILKSDHNIRGKSFDDYSNLFMQQHSNIKYNIENNVSLFDFMEDMIKTRVESTIKEYLNPNNKED